MSSADVGRGDGLDADRAEWAARAAGQHASMMWWFSRESPREQQWRIDLWSYGSDFDIVDRSERPDKPTRYRYPDK